MMESDVALNQTVAINQKAEYDSKRLTWGYNALIWGTLETRRKTASSTKRTQYRQEGVSLPVKLSRDSALQVFLVLQGVTKMHP